MQDIAIMTNDATRCNYYQSESENVKGRGECILPDQVLLHNANKDTLVVPNTQEECEVRILNFYSIYICKVLNLCHI